MINCFNFYLNVITSFNHFLNKNNKKKCHFHILYIHIWNPQLGPTLYNVFGNIRMYIFTFVYTHVITPKKSIQISRKTIFFFLEYKKLYVVLAFLNITKSLARVFFSFVKKHILLIDVLFFHRNSK